MANNRGKSTKNMKTRQAKKIAKAAVLNTTSEQRQAKKQLSTAAIESLRQIVDMLKPIELSHNHRLYTFQTMLRDDAVRPCYEARSMAIEKAQARGYWEHDNNDEQSVYLKALLDYTTYHLDGQTPRSIGKAASEMLINGWSPFEQVFETIYDPYSEFDGMFRLKKLAYIHPLTLDQCEPFKVKEGGNEIINLRQSSTAFIGSDGVARAGRRLLSWSGVKDIPYNRIAHCSYSTSSSIPIGDSILEAAYTVWREKTLLQEMTIVGVNKDFAGTPIIYLPDDLLSAATANPSGREAQMVSEIKTSMACMHTGDQSYVMLPSDTQSETGVGAKRFEMKFLGVEGGGKGFNIGELVEQRRRAIFTVMGCQSLIAGESGGGSYNLNEGNVTVQAHFVERDCMIIEEMWNKQIIPKLLRLNRIKVEDVTKIPLWTSGDVQEVSMEEHGKYVNRVARLLPAVPEVGNKMLKMLGIDYRIPLDTTPDEIRAMGFDFVEESKTGTGDGSSGNGQAVQGNSDTNSENKA